MEREKKIAETDDYQFNSDDKKLDEEAEQLCREIDGVLENHFTSKKGRDERNAGCGRLEFE